MTALEEAERQGRASLGDIRRLIALLRADADSAVSAPQPGLSEIHDLVQGYQAAGLPVTLISSLNGSRTTPTAELAIYRVVQEALTNAARHGSGAATVAIDASGDAIQLSIENPARSVRALNRGSGIAGMRERIAAAGGTVEIGTRDGRWVVRGVGAGRGNRMIRVLLVDDQPLARAGLRLILGPEPGIEIAGECDDGDQVEEAVRRLKPDVVVMDVRMRRVDGAEATRRLQESADPPPVLILTTFDDDDTVAAALGAGAAGFILKDAPGEDIVRATVTIAGGGSWLDPQVTPRVLAAYRRVSTVSRDMTERLDRLTPRERDVLREIGKGSTNAEIAGTLFISEATVKSHLGNVLAKLGLRDRAAAIVFAHTHGIVGP